jgi:hypothetical protein
VKKHNEAKRMYTLLIIKMDETIERRKKIRIEKDKELPCDRLKKKTQGKKSIPFERR